MYVDYNTYIFAKKLNCMLDLYYQNLTRKIDCTDGHEIRLR